MTWLLDIFSLIVLTAGWYYLFYSPAAHRLAEFENQRLNTFRIRLRRVNGVIMMLLAVALFRSMRVNTQRAVAWIFMSIIILMACMMALALIDLHLTRKLRRRKK